MVNYSLFSLVSVLTLSSFSVVFSLIDCDNVLRDGKPFTGLCNNKWSNLKPLLKPMQSEVGYAWVQHKLEKDFTTQSKTQTEMDANPIPCVIGPDSFLYVVDHHHELCALDYANYADVVVTVQVICDKSTVPTMDIFWNEMITEKLVYLGSHPNSDYTQLPIALSPSQLPSAFYFTKDKQLFSNDPWRSLASYSRKVNSAYQNATDCAQTKTSVCYRSFYRGCVDGYAPSGSGVAFFEFRWGYFYLDSTLYSTQYWTDSSQLSTFYTAFAQQATKAMGSSSESDWKTIASLSIPVTRAPLAASYHTPPSVFMDDISLPGYIMGETTMILDDDPSCSFPACS